MKSRQLLFFCIAIIMAVALYFSNSKYIDKPQESNNMHQEQKQLQQNNDDKKNIVSTKQAIIKKDVQAEKKDTKNNQTARFIETIDFKTLPKATMIQTKSTYENIGDLCDKNPVVTEFFSYGCPGCSSVAPFFNTWLKSKKNNVKFIRYPVDIHDPNDMLAKAFYTNKYLGYDKLDQVDAVLFDLGTNPRNMVNINTIVNKLKLVIPNFDEKKYMETFNNISQATISQGKSLFRKYKLTGTPSVVVNNKYIVKLNSYDRMFATINHLTEREDTVCPSNS